jgi:SNF2 family DNA or RNA helicase
VSFKKLYQPELLTAEEMDDDSETADESETELEIDDDPTLGGFIVPDEDDTDLVKGSGPRDKGKGPLKKIDGKKRYKQDKKLDKRKAKAIAKASDKHERLALLKKASIGSKPGKRLFMKELDKDYTYSAKIRRMMQLIEEIGTANPQEKVLVFSQFTTLLDYAEIPLIRHNVQYVRYDGSMTATERVRATDEFRLNDSVRVMIVSLKAGNAGLNLNVANHVIILDPFWNPYTEEQAIDRAHRIGQMRDVQVYRIVVHNTVEDRIFTLQEKKRKVINRALDEDDMREMGRLGQRELQYLFGM